MPSTNNINNNTNILGGVKNFKSPIVSNTSQEELQPKFTENGQILNNAPRNIIGDVGNKNVTGPVVNNGNAYSGPNLSEGMSGQNSETNTGNSSSIDVTNSNNINQINNLINSPLTEEEEEILSDYDWYKNIIYFFI